jgi:hypothetical protein
MLNVVAPSGQPYKTLIAKITLYIRVKNIMLTTLLNLLTNICGQGKEPTLRVEFSKGSTRVGSGLTRKILDYADSKGCILSPSYSL